MNITLTDQRTQALQSECNEYNEANGTSLTLDQFVQMLCEVRADASVRKYAVITPFAFVQRFTPQEYSAIKTAAGSDAAVAGMLQQLEEASSVDLTIESVVEGLAYLQSKNLLSPARAAAIGAIA